VQSLPSSPAPRLKRKVGHLRVHRFELLGELPADPIAFPKRRPAPPRDGHAPATQSQGRHIRDRCHICDRCHIRDRCIRPVPFGLPKGCVQPVLQHPPLSHKRSTLRRCREGARTRIELVERLALAAVAQNTSWPHETGHQRGHARSQARVPPPGNMPGSRPDLFGQTTAAAANPRARMRPSSSR
jgi:hypothetical protein